MISDALPLNVTVSLESRAYDITIGSGILSSTADWAGQCLDLDAEDRKTALVVTDSRVRRPHADVVRDSLNAAGWSCELHELPSGENSKSLNHIAEIYDRLVEFRADRGTVVFAVGGGVVGDAAGFAAATYARGIPFIQIPTTLLAHVDSSVGGKVGINHPRGKNLIGAFYQPAGVLIDTATLQTLPPREYRSGLAEVIKYGAIADRDFFGWLEQNIDALRAKDPQALAHAIQRSCEIKAEVVADDEREAGRRAILNFGHTFGHAIERCQGYGDWLHGEAVAAGMVMAAELSGIAAADPAYPPPHLAVLRCGLNGVQSHFGHGIVGLHREVQRHQTR